MKDGKEGALLSGGYYGFRDIDSKGWILIGGNGSSIKSSSRVDF